MTRYSFSSKAAVSLGSSPLDGTTQSNWRARSAHYTASDIGVNNTRVPG